ncbi:MAG: hypothetical protein ACOCXJ_05045, partial [Planctomycetota bacterium]
HLVAAYRKALRERGQEREHERAVHEAHLVWLRRVLGDSEAPEPGIKPHGEAKRLLKQALEAVQERDCLDASYRQLHEENAEQRATIEQLRHELRARDELLTRYEFGERAHVEEDERLRLYRVVVARYEAGEEPGAALEQVRRLEMVITVAPQQEHQNIAHCDRQLGMLSECLGDLRRILPLSEDPRRFRPRLLASSPYRLKTLVGQFQALRDAARDVLTYVDRARWAVGLTQLQREFGRLRRVFQEMVRLTAELGERAGAEPPVSLTLSLDTNVGLANLPGVLAEDVERLVRKKGVGPKTMNDLAELLEETVRLFHASLVKAVGKPIERRESPNRESAKKTLQRLCRDLRDLSALMHGVFAEAAEKGYELSAQEERLIEDHSRLLLAVQQVDGAVQALALLPGAPGAELGRLPRGKRADWDALLDSCRDRVTWLETLAQYRVALESD